MRDKAGQGHGMGQILSYPLFLIFFNRDGIRKQDGMISILPIWA